MRYVESLSDARTKYGKRPVSARRGWVGEKSDFFSILLGKSCDVRLRDRPALDPVSADIRLRFFHEGDDQIGGDREIDLRPDFFVVGGNLDIGD